MTSATQRMCACECVMERTLKERTREKEEKVKDMVHTAIENYHL